MLQGSNSLNNEKNLLERRLKAEHSRYVDKDEEFLQKNKRNECSQAGRIWCRM